MNFYWGFSNSFAFTTMKLRISIIACLLSFSSLFHLSIAQSDRSLETEPAEVEPAFASLEEAINHFVGAYSFNVDNRFKLAAYSELRGELSPDGKKLTLDFGNLGTLFFFEKNCLLRNYKNEVYYLNANEGRTPQAMVMNRGVTRLFEHINLMGNHDASPSRIRFVDENLSRKNIEPFYKLFVRHILIHYGRYDSINAKVEFHTDYMADKLESDGSYDHAMLVRKQNNPLKMVLTEDEIRGWYLDIGGEVFINDEKRDVFFVTGEDYKYNNVTAFKLFISKLFSQTIQYVAPTESKRIASYTRDEQVRDGLIAQAATSAQNLQEIVKKVERYKKRQSVGPMYTPFDWIPMMLGILRSNQVNIGDPDIIKYFVDRDYFPRIYQQLLDKEKRLVDKYLRLKRPGMVLPAD